MKGNLKLLLLLPMCWMTIAVQAQDLHKHNEDLTCVNKNFNTLVHVAVDSAGRLPIVDENFIIRLLGQTSNLFEPICMSFTNCEINIMEDNYNYSSIENSPISVENQLIKMDNMFSKNKRINIFISNYISDFYCGYGVQDGLKTSDEANVYIAIKGCPEEAYLNLAHQLGHLLGLYDTNYLDYGLELADGSNCSTTGDQICDTPADPYRKIELKDIYVNEDCEFIFETKDPNDNYYEPQVGNIMGLYECKCGFTREQYLKMVETYQNSPFKQY